MAHYAQLDDDNYVLRVSKIDDIYEMDAYCEVDEYRAELHLKKLHGENTRWKKTSYNHNIRGRFACIGDRYHAEGDVFINPQPYASWTLDENYDWQPPVPKPETEGNTHWDWNETEQRWEIEEQ